VSARDRPLAVHDLVDAARRHADFLGYPVLRNPHWLHEVMQQNFTGVDG